MGKLFDLAVVKARDLPQAQRDEIGLTLLGKLDPTIAKQSWEVLRQHSAQSTGEPSIELFGISAMRDLDSKGAHRRVPGSKRLVWQRRGFYSWEFGVVLTGAELPWRIPGKVDPILWFWKGEIADFEAFFTR